MCLANITQPDEWLNYFRWLLSNLLLIWTCLPSYGARLLYCNIRLLESAASIETDRTKLTQVERHFCQPLETLARDQLFGACLCSRNGVHSNNECGWRHNARTRFRLAWTRTGSGQRSFPCGNASNSRPRLT